MYIPRLVKGSVVWSKNPADKDFPWRVRAECREQRRTSCKTKIWIAARLKDMEDETFFSHQNWKCSSLEKDVVNHIDNCSKADALAVAVKQYADIVNRLNRNADKPKSQHEIRTQISADAKLTAMARGQLFTAKSKNTFSKNARRYEVEIKKIQTDGVSDALPEWLTKIGTCDL